MNEARVIIQHVPKMQKIEEIQAQGAKKEEREECEAKPIV
jgi:hypothetical protein